MLHFLASIDELHEIIALGAVLAVSALAIGLGSPPQKMAGALQLFDTLSLAVLTAFLTRHDRVLAIDGRALFILAAYFALTIRWRDSFIVILASLQAFAVLIHLSVWLDQSIITPVNGLLLNITGWLMLAVLGGATVMGRLHRSRFSAPRG